MSVIRISTAVALLSVVQLFPNGTGEAAPSYASRSDVQYVKAGETASGGAAVLAPPVECFGDCNGDGRVTVDEIITIVNIVLGNLPLSSCHALPATPAPISVQEIIESIDSALSGCS